MCKYIGLKCIFSRLVSLTSICFVTLDFSSVHGKTSIHLLSVSKSILTGIFFSLQKIFIKPNCFYIPIYIFLPNEMKRFGVYLSYWSPLQQGVDFFTSLFFFVFLIIGLIKRSLLLFACVWVTGYILELQSQL